MLQYAFPVVGSLGGLIFLITNPKPLMVVGGLTFALASVGMGVGMGVQQRGATRNRLRTLRERYLQYVADTRRAAREVAGRQRAASAFRNPGPDQLPAIARSDTRRWERRGGDPDYLVVRVASGSVRLASPLRLDEGSDPLAWNDPVCAVAAEQLVEVHGQVHDQPITVPLESFPISTIVGPTDLARGLARAIVAQVATLHAPEDVRIAVCGRPDHIAAWDALKWLPHTEPTLRSDGMPVGPSVATDAEGLHSRVVGEIEALTRAQPAGESQPLEAPTRRLVVVVEGVVPGPETVALVRRQGSPVRLLVLAPTQRDEPTAVDLRLRLDGAALQIEANSPIQRRGKPEVEAEVTATSGRADSMGPSALETLARTLAPVRLTMTSEGGTLSRAIDLPELLGIDDLSNLDTRSLWAVKPLRDRLRVPMGFDPEGNAVILDIKESDLGGDGPHGLVIGATGSGKSELLRTIITGLALTHSPSLLSFVLVDFKGGAAFAGLSSFPHVSGVITNLADDLSMIDRMYAALFGEIRRRQELLRDAGNVASVRDYHKLQEAGRELPPLPYVLIVVDEFGELLSNRPEFIDLFVAVGRLGRSLGMHLLLSSQQLDEGRLRGLESHLSYRIALRTFSASESRTVLGVPDAYYLPPLPGSGYLRTGPSGLHRFRAATVSLPARMGPAEVVVAKPEPFTLLGLPETSPGPAAPAKSVDKPGRRSASLPTVVDVVVAALKDAAPPVHQIWQPPLPAKLTLDALLGPAVTDTERGLQATERPLRALEVPLGLVDKPAAQEVGTFSLGLAGSAGSLLVVGAPQTGKSTLLQTLVVSLALTTTPRETEIHVIDFGGGSLTGVAHLPHVGTVCGRDDPERVRRTVAELSARVDGRERYFRSRGIASAEAMRQSRAAGTLDEPMPDVYLVVDNWPAMRVDHEDLEPQLTDLAARGLGYGLHVVITANRWVDLRKSLIDSIAGRLELRLQEPGESNIDRKAAANVAPRIPGRALAPGPLHVQVALPRLDGKTVTTDLPRAVMDLVDRVAGAWTGSQAEQNSGPSQPSAGGRNAGRPQRDRRSARSCGVGPGARIRRPGREGRQPADPRRRRVRQDNHDQDTTRGASGPLRPQSRADQPH